MSSPAVTINEYKEITPPALIEITRGKIVESWHRAHVCICNSDGELLLSIGDPNLVTFMRSSAKPLQAAAGLKLGIAAEYHLTTREIAIMAGSHGGEDIHTETVQAILAKIGADEQSLQCGTHYPLDTYMRKRLRISQEKPSQLHHNCSGKHAGMLLMAHLLKSDLADYLNKDKEVQKCITEFIAVVSEFEKDKIVIGLDGCNLPVHALPLKNAALAFSRFIDPVGLSSEYSEPLAVVADAMRSFPEMIAANKERICTELMRAVPDRFEFIAKAGAEGYYASAWRNPEDRKGIGFVVKVEDGAERGRNPLLKSVLQSFGVLPEQIPKELDKIASEHIKNHSGITVGKVKVNL